MSIVIDDIIWLDTVVEKLAWEHRVLPYEVEEVLSGKCRIFKKESSHVDNEDLYNALGLTTGGRFISVFLTKKLNNKALVITARDMNNHVRRRYEKK